MRIASIAGAGIAASLVAGCAWGPAPYRGYAPGQELVGRTLGIVARGDQRSTLHFHPNGAVTAAFGGRSVNGRWWTAQRRLCFQWAGATTECWPYRRPFLRGDTVRITSDRGNVIDATLL